MTEVSNNQAEEKFVWRIVIRIEYKSRGRMKLNQSQLTS